MQYRKSSLIGDKVLRLIFYLNDVIGLSCMLEKGGGFSEKDGENLGFV